MAHEILLRNELDALQDASFDAILTFDKTGLVIAANDGAALMFGYTTRVLVGMQIISLMTDGDAGRERASLALTGSSHVIGGLNKVRSVQGKRSSGEEFPFRMSVREIKSDGAPLYLCVANDLTSVEQARRRVLELHTRLKNYSDSQEAKIVERTAQLENSLRAIAEVNRRLALEMREREDIARNLQKREMQLERLLFKERELNELRSRFVTMASHEFRTPLTAMLSSVDVIEMATAEPSPTLLKHIGRVRENIGYLRNILEDFLQLGKLDVHGTDLHLQKVNLKNLFEQFIDELSMVCLPGQEIVTEISADLGDTVHSLNGLRLVCTNLITNAIKYSPEGTAIFFNASLRGTGRLQISVHDQGMGIPAEELPHLFERFYRATNAETIKGTGLGLHIAKQYVLAMDGQIEVTKSNSVDGTTIVVELPLNLADNATLPVRRKAKRS